MSRLEGVSLVELRDTLDEVSSKKPTQRLTAAILYKQGPSVPTIAEWFDLRAATIYRWFDRMESEPLEEAIRDRPRPGRPSKLAPDHRERLREVVSAAPSEQGYPGSQWTADAVADFVEAEFGIRYSNRHARRLLNRAAQSARSE